MTDHCKSNKIPEIYFDLENAVLKSFQISVLLCRLLSDAVAGAVAAVPVEGRPSLIRVSELILTDEAHVCCIEGRLSLEGVIAEVGRSHRPEHVAIFCWIWTGVYSLFIW